MVLFSHQMVFKLLPRDAVSQVLELGFELLLPDPARVVVHRDVVEPVVDADGRHAPERVQLPLELRGPAPAPDVFHREIRACLGHVRSPSALGVGAQRRFLGVVAGIEAVVRRGIPGGLELFPRVFPGLAVFFVLVVHFLTPPSSIPPEARFIPFRPDSCKSAKKVEITAHRDIILSVIRKKDGVL